MAPSNLYQQRHSALNSCVDQIIRDRRRFTEDEFWRDFRERTRLHPRDFGYSSVNALLEFRGCQRDGDIFTYDKISALRQKSLRLAKELGEFDERDFTEGFKKRYTAKKIFEPRTLYKFKTVPLLLTSLPGVRCARSEAPGGQLRYIYERPPDRRESSARIENGENEAEEDSESDDEGPDPMDWKEQQRRFHRTVDALLGRLHRFSKREFAHNLCEFFVGHFEYDSVEKLLEKRGCIRNGKQFVYEKTFDGVSTTLSQLDEGEILNEKTGFNLLVNMALRRLQKFKLKHFESELSEVLASYYDYRSVKKLLKKRGCERDGEEFTYDEVSVLKWKAEIISRRLREFTESEFAEEFRRFFNSNTVKWRRSGFDSLFSLLEAIPGVERRILIRGPGEEVKYFYRRVEEEDSMVVEAREARDRERELLEEERKEKVREETKSRIVSIARRRGTIFENEVTLLYKETYDEPLKLEKLGYETIADLLKSIPEIDWISGGRYRIKGQFEVRMSRARQDLDAERLDEDGRQKRKRLVRRALRVARELRVFYEQEFGAAYRRTYEEKMNLRQCGFESITELLKSLRELNYRRDKRFHLRPEYAKDSVNYERESILNEVSQDVRRKSLDAQESGGKQRIDEEKELEEGEIVSGEDSSEAIRAKESEAVAKEKGVPQLSSDISDDVEVIEPEVILLDGDDDAEESLLNSIPKTGASIITEITLPVAVSAPESSRVGHEGIGEKRSSNFVDDIKPPTLKKLKTPILQESPLKFYDSGNRLASRTSFKRCVLSETNVLEREGERGAKGVPRRLFSDFVDEIELIEPEVVLLDGEDEGDALLNSISKTGAFEMSIDTEIPAPEAVTSSESSAIRREGIGEKRPLSTVITQDDGDIELPTLKKLKTSISEESPLKGSRLAGRISFRSRVLSETNVLEKEGESGGKEDRPVSPPEAATSRDVEDR